MAEVRALTPDALRWRCDPDQLGFTTTDELEDLQEILGQARALDAVQFGIGIRQQGYNLFVLGPPGVGKRTIVQRFLEQQSSAEAVPSDWCYVQDFDQPHVPKALSLPAGRAVQLQQDMQELVEDLRTTIPAALQVEEHQNSVKEVERQAKELHERAVKRLAEKAAEQDIQLVRTPGGFAMAPMRDGEVISPEDFEKLTEDDRKRIEATVEALQDELTQIIETVPARKKEMRDRIKELNREATKFAVRHSLAEVKNKYRDLPAVLEYFEAVERNVTENTEEFETAEEEHPVLMAGLNLPGPKDFQRYEVNLLVDNSHTEGAPVIFEDHPSHHKLLGRVEQKSQMGTLVTDFTLIKPGALHRANGGYLVVEAIRLLQQPFAWEGLKRALQARRIKIESLAESLSLVSTVSLEPEPIPLDVKVILLGERLLYYLLHEYDRDFAELFKVAADFEDQMDLDPENVGLYAQLIATLARRRDPDRQKADAGGDSPPVRPLDASAVARVIEHSAREAEDSEKLSTHIRTLADLLLEADYWASRDGVATISASHVQMAIDKQVYRLDRVRDRIQEGIQRGTLLIETDGQRVGQVNGLSVLAMGSFSFGQPSRITATARLGKGEVVDIEREVELGGSLHSKGVMILTSLLASRYAKDHPLSLSASLVFEQSYGPVEGDSASVAELCALLSALSEIPIHQSLAVTGSVDQHGQVQPIGGVNQKIEGFFDVCRARGLTGRQGVLIPASNVKHLMLREEVVQAAREGKFHIYPVETVDQAISLLTGEAAGQRDPTGQYPQDSVNRRVEARLIEFFQLRQKYNTNDSARKARSKETGSADG